MVLQFMPQVQSIFDGLAPVLIGLMDSLMPMLFNLVETVFPILVGLLEALLPSFIQITETLLPVLLQVVDMLLPPLIQIVQALLPPLVQLLQPLLNLLSPLLNLLQPILDLVVAVIAPLGNLISGLLTPLITIVSKLIEVALKPLQLGFEVLSDTLTSVVNYAFESVMNKVNTIKGVFSGIIQFIKGVFTGDWKSAWEGVKKIFSSIADGIGKAFKTPINFIIDLINNFIKGINKISIPDWVPGVGGKGINIPLIPKLARGGILEKGQVGLLEGNGAEAVVPLDQNAKWIRSVSQDMAMQGIGGAIDYDRLSVAVVEAIREVIPELQNTQRIETDESGIFRVVRDKAREFTQKTGNPAFA
jgi:phage-related protein